MQVGKTDEMLFDLVTDPAETRDVAAEHPERVAQMARTLADWRASCKNSLAGRGYPTP